MTLIMTNNDILAQSPPSPFNSDYFDNSDNVIIIKKVRFKRSIEFVWLPYSINPSSITEGDFVVCRTNHGLNIGIVLETSTENESNNNDNDNNDTSGEIIGLATCEQMDSLQTKLKNESYLLEICHDYLLDMEEFSKEIGIIDVEFQMDGSLIVFYELLTSSSSSNNNNNNNNNSSSSSSSSSSVSPTLTQSLSSILTPFLMGIEFSLIHIACPELFQPSKPFVDLLTCSLISSIGTTITSSPLQYLSSSEYVSLQCASDSD